MSRSTQRKAHNSIRQLLTSCALSFNTKADYQQLLKLCIRQLDTQGFHLSHIKQLKQKHLKTLVSQWQSQGLQPATLKNRLSSLRTACRLMGKRQVVQSNKDYDLARRQYQPTENKAVTDLPLDKITDPHLKLSLALQQAFGLRREECLKIKPTQADRGTVLILQGSWTKGGITRHIPIVTDQQRQILDAAKQFVKYRSMIPKHRRYIQQRHCYDRQTHQAGLSHLHGLRHAYAQQRYQTLTALLDPAKQGWQSPINGGLLPKAMTPAQRQIDQQVRAMVTQELGHSRLSITRIYLG